MRLEQDFASKIYDQVSTIYKQISTEYKEKKEAEKIYKRYGSMAYTLPILVRTAGLAQALAFVESKSKKDSNHPYTYLLNHLAEVVINNKNGSEFAKQSREADLQEYMYLTRRTMLALKWYKRFAESVLGIKSTDQIDDGGEND